MVAQFRELSSVAVLGLGVIGQGMASRIATAAVELVVWNRTAETARRVAPGNATIATSATGAAAMADLVIVSLSDDAAVWSVLVEDAGMADALRSGTIVVDTSTVAPQTSRDVAGSLAGLGVTYIDAPVTGGAEKARDGTLTLLCGGPEPALDHVRPVLDMVAARVVRFGDVGAGQYVKAINQVMLAGALAGVAEGVALAEAARLDAASIVAALVDGAAASWVLSQRAPLMISRDLRARGRIALHLKDLRIAMQTTAELGFEAPLTALVESLEARVVDAGYGDEDVSALIRAYATDGRRPGSGADSQAERGSC